MLSAPASEDALPVGSWELAACDAATPGQLEREDLAWISAPVPGTVAEALLANGVAPAALSDLDATAWWYRGTVVVPRSAPVDAVLRSESLATLADVWVDGRHVAASSSMFIPLAVVVRLEPGEHPVHVRFGALRRNWPRRPRARWHGSTVVHRDLRWVRTTLLGRTPGDSPPLPPVGPVSGLEFVAHGLAAWEDVELQSRIVGRAGTVTFAATLRAPELPVVEFAVDGADTECATVRALAPGSWQATASATVPDAERWWPATHGSPTLYELTLRAACGGIELPTIRRHVGFRELALDDGFGFVLNGVPIFCRGACWTPLDLSTLRDEPAALEAALDDLVDAGMNMIRLAGGTLYAGDELLDACDRWGVLVWQDFMFGPLDHPFEDDGFRKLALAEAQHVVRRMRWRPCLAMLCGSSEYEQRAAILGGLASDDDGAFFRRELRELCAEMAPRLPYVPSSPTGGPAPFMPSEQCTHYYGVGAYGRPIDDARTSRVRFASECLAFSNVPDGPVRDLALGPTRSPSGPTWKAGSPRDLGAGWDFDDVRDRYFEEVFDGDARTLRTRDPERYLDLSALVSGEIMARTFALWRDRRSACRGGLVWFLRDLAPGAGFGLVDHVGRPKPAFEVLAPALQPIATFLVDDGLNGLTLVAVNDTGADISAEVRIRIGTFGGVVQGEAQTTLELPARSTREWALVELTGGFRDLNYAYRFGPLEHDVVHVRADVQDDVLDAWHFPAPLPVRRDDALAITVGPRAAGDRDRVEVAATRFAQYVSIAQQGRCLARTHIAPWEPAVVAVSPTGGPIVVHAANADAAVRIDPDQAMGRKPVH